MGQNLKTRIILDILIIFSIALLPWWFTTILIVVGIFLFELFYEALLFGLIIDSLSGIPRELFFGKSFIYLLIIIILFVIINWLKNRLRI